MQFVLKHLRAFVIGVFTLVVVPVLTTVVIDYLKEKNQYRPGKLVDSVLSVIHAIGASPWSRGAALVLTGLFIGILLDSLRRLKERPDLQAQGDRIDAQLPVEDRRATLKLRLEEAKDALGTENRLLRGEVEKRDARIAEIENSATAVATNTPEEVFEMEFARTIWVQNGYDTCRAVANMLDDIARNRSHELKYLRLFQHPRDDLNKAVDAFDPCVNPNAARPFAELQKKLEAVVWAYCRGVMWLNEYLLTNPTYEADAAKHVGKWRASHEGFQDSLNTTLHPRSRFSHLRILFEKDSRKFRLSTE